MSYFDKLKKATFGGVLFYVDTVEFHSGREIKVHDFKASAAGSITRKVIKAVTGNVDKKTSSSETPLIEDLGSRAFKYIVNGYFLEGRGMPDYLKTRDQFIELVNDGKTHILQLPSYKKFSVKAGKFHTIFSNKQGGQEKFKIVFYEEVLNDQPAITEDTQQVVILAIEDLIAASKKLYDDKFNVESPTTETKNRYVTETGAIAVIIDGEDFTAPYVAEETESMLDTFADYVKTFTGYGETIVDELNDYIQILNGYKTQIDTLILFPSQLATSTMDMVTQLSGIFTSPITTFNAQRDLFSNFADQLDEVIGDTLDKFSLQDNRTTLVGSVRNAAAGEMMIAASAVEYKSSLEALAVRDLIVELVDALQLENTDELFTTMRALLAASTIDLTERAALLPFVEEINTNESLPLLVVSYGMYNDASRFQEIADRNEVKNNLLPPSTLQVLER